MALKINAQAQVPKIQQKQQQDKHNIKKMPTLSEKLPTNTKTKAQFNKLKSN